MIWKTSRRELNLDRTLIMAILNVTPDSFSDGGQFLSVDDALKQAERYIEEGAGILDIGGESTRPGSERVAADEEIRRIVPVIEAVATRFDIPISVDTSKSEVAEAAVTAGAEIINDISGLRFDERIAEVAARHKAGLVLMHSRGEFETMHKQPPVDDIIADVSDGFVRSIDTAQKFGVSSKQIALDPGIGFSKTPEQNLELLSKLDILTSEFSAYPMLIGTSRKSFIGKILGDAAPIDGRLSGTLASVAIAVWNGAHIVRVHDVKATVDAIRVVEAIKSAESRSEGVPQ